MACSIWRVPRISIQQQVLPHAAFRELHFQVSNHFTLGYLLLKKQQAQKSDNAQVRY